MNTGGYIILAMTQITPMMAKKNAQPIPHPVCRSLGHPSQSGWPSLYSHTSHGDSCLAVNFMADIIPQAGRV